MRLKALAEIYKMHSFAQLCNLFCLSFAKMFPKFALIKVFFDFFEANSSKLLEKNIILEHF